MTIIPNQLVGYVVVGQVVLQNPHDLLEIATHALVVKRPWPEPPLGTNLKKTIAEDARRWIVTFDHGVIVLTELVAS